MFLQIVRNFFGDQGVANDLDPNIAAGRPAGVAHAAAATAARIDDRVAADANVIDSVEQVLAIVDDKARVISDNLCDGLGACALIAEGTTCDVCATCRCTA